jgi:hypothetical protein
MQDLQKSTGTELDTIPRREHKFNGVRSGVNGQPGSQQGCRRLPKEAHAIFLPFAALHPDSASSEIEVADPQPPEFLFTQAAICRQSYECAVAAAFWSIRANLKQPTDLRIVRRVGKSLGCSHCHPCHWISSKVPRVYAPPTEGPQYPKWLMDGDRLHTRPEVSKVAFDDFRGNLCENVDAASQREPVQSECVGSQRGMSRACYFSPTEEGFDSFGKARHHLSPSLHESE